MDGTMKEAPPEWWTLSRAHLAQITDVNVAKGTCSAITLEGNAIVRKDLEIPVLWHSIQGVRENGQLTSAFRSSWGRFVPSKNDFVYLDFNPKGQAVITGMATLPARKQGDTGQQEALKSTADYPEEKFRSSAYTSIKEGEFDFLSSGGAYIHGTDTGLLFLGNALSSVEIDRLTASVKATASHFSLSTGSQYSLSATPIESTKLRIGEVRRIIPSTSPVSLIKPTAIPGAQEEWSHVATVTGPLYDRWAGSCFSAKGSPLLMRTGLPATFYEATHIAGSTDLNPLFGSTRRVDFLGNVEQTYTTMTMGPSAAAVSLPIVHGPQLVAALTDIATALTATATGMKTSATSLDVIATGAAIAFTAAGVAIDAAVSTLTTIISSVGPEGLLSTSTFIE